MPSLSESQHISTSPFILKFYPEPLKLLKVPPLIVFTDENNTHGTFKWIYCITHNSILSNNLTMSNKIWPTYTRTADIHGSNGGISWFPTAVSQLILEWEFSKNPDKLRGGENVLTALNCRASCVVMKPHSQPFSPLWIYPDTKI